MAKLPVQPSDNRPVISINIEELKFWLSIMQEHALFIKAGLPANRKEAIQEAQEFYRCFGSLLAKAEAVNSDKKFKEVVRQSAEKVEEFYRFKRRLLQLALRGELGGALYPSLLDHVSREAEYFLRLLESMNDCKAFRLWPKTKEMNFWIRLMSDHSDFIRQMLDPSEVILIDTAEGFTDEFDELFRQSIDFSSMLRGASSGAPAFNRFIQDTRVATLRLRDFKRALYMMLEEKKVLGLINPLFADHVRREADHFLMIAAMLDNNLQTSGFNSTNSVVMPLAEEDIEDAMADVEIEEAVAPAAVAAPTVPIVSASPANINCQAEAKLATLKQKYLQTETMTAEPVNTVQQSMVFDSDALEEIDDDEAPELPIAPTQATVTSAPKLKYTWSSAWPRPIGKER